MIEHLLICLTLLRGTGAKIYKCRTQVIYNIAPMIISMCWNLALRISERERRLLSISHSFQNNADEVNSSLAVSEQCLSACWPWSRIQSSELAMHLQCAFSHVRAQSGNWRHCPSSGAQFLILIMILIKWTYSSFMQEKALVNLFRSGKCQ